MKQSVLLGILLPLSYAQISERLTYPSFIESFSMSWTNPDVSTESSSEFQSGLSQEYLTDEDLTAGDQLSFPTISGAVWGTTGGSTVGMVGTFTANTLAVPSGYAYWSITSAALSFYTQGCLDADSTATLTYVDFFTGAQKTKTVTASYDSTDGVATFTADINSNSEVYTTGWVTFDVQGNTYCESFITLTEFALQGEAKTTPDPTPNPTPFPTPDPTTSSPTPAPTAECKGEVTWGDPHYTLMAMAENTKQFNYQGLGWHYYSFPCDWDDYENWPYFYLSYHKQCNGAKSCIKNNRLVLNTKPNPWIIDFYNRDGISALTVGSDVSLSASDFDLADYTFKKLKNRDSSNPVIINYNDGQGQYGQMRISYHQGSRLDIVLREVSTSLIASSRTDCSGSDCDQCDGRMFKIGAENSWTWHSCPYCLRNIQCGLMGKYIRGDCSKNQLQDTSHECSQILVKSDDGNNRAVSPAYGDTNFGTFAATWKKTYVDNIITGKGLSVVSSHSEKERIFEARQAAKTQDLVPGKLDGRGIGINYDDLSLLDGNCQNNPTVVRQMNETCRQNTMVKYQECCDEIGFCSLLWNACIEDMCACTRPDAPDNATESWCLAQWVLGPMNATCSVDEFYPTASPTRAPTPAPVFSINSIISGDENDNPLLVPMVIFAVVMVLLLIGACVWWKKRSRGKAYFKEDDDDHEMEHATGTTV